MEFLAPIDPKDFQDAGALKKFVFDLMWKELSR